MYRWKKRACIFLAFFLIILLVPQRQAEAAKKKADKLTFGKQYGTVVMKKGSKRTLLVRCNKKKIRASQLKWKSSKKSVVSVVNGKLTAKRSGSATISVTRKGKKSNTLKCKVYVYKKTVSTSFQEGRGTVVINKGKSEVLKPSRKGSYTTFSSSNKKVATVTNSGKVKAKKSGTATITCYSVGTYRYKASIKVKVGKRVTGISIGSSENEITPILGEQYHLTAKATPSNASIKKLIFSSSNPEVAKVSSDGVIQTISEGMAVISIQSTDGSEVERKLRVYVTESSDDFSDASTAEAARRSQWVAHRGMNKKAPENTLPAFEMAGKYGFQLIECDIRETKDGELVISHDATLERMCGVDQSISDLTLEQIRQYPITGGSNADQYPENRIPTLKEFLECCNTYGCTPMVEVKSSVSRKGLRYLYQQLSLSEKEPIVISFYNDILTYLRGLDPDLKLQKVMRELTSSTFAKCKKYKWDVDLDYDAVNYSTVQKVHKAGLKLNVWTVNSRNIARLFQKWGVDYISSDYKFF